MEGEIWCLSILSYENIFSPFLFGQHVTNDKVCVPNIELLGMDKKTPAARHAKCGPFRASPADYPFQKKFKI